MDYLLYPNGQKADFDYHPNALDLRLKEIQNLGPGGAVISKFNYLYDTRGRVNDWTQFHSAMTTAQKYVLGHDDAAQLRTADLKDAVTETLIEPYLYNYDAAANRTSEQIGAGVTTWVPNSFNQLASQSGSAGARTFSYDLNGAMTSDGGTRTFEWDGAGRLCAINYTGTTNRSEFSYDGLGRRVKIVEKTGGPVPSEKRFVWEGMAIFEERDVTNSLQKRFFAQGEQRGGLDYFYDRDHLGSVRELTDTAGAVRARYDYDPYGRRTKLAGDLDADFGYTGHYQHGPSALTLAPYRAYDANFARWLSRDPLEDAELQPDGPNLYGYVGNSPVNSIDPLGLQSFEEIDRQLKEINRGMDAMDARERALLDELRDPRTSDEGRRLCNEGLDKIQNARQEAKKKQDDLLDKRNKLKNPPKRKWLPDPKKMIKNPRKPWKWW